MRHAKIANTSSSSIRHWEKEGLIKPDHHHEKGFRTYNPADIRKYSLSEAFKKVAYSLNLSELDEHNVSQAKEIALKSLQYMYHSLVEQVRGIAYLDRFLER